MCCVVSAVGSRGGVGSGGATTVMVADGAVHGAHVAGVGIDTARADALRT